MAKKKKRKIKVRDFLAVINKDKNFFPLTANLEYWWRHKSKSTPSKRTMHLTLVGYAYDLLKSLGFDVKLEGDLEVREWSTRGNPKVYDSKVGVKATKKIGDKVFEIDFEAEEPSWHHFYYTRIFKINGKRVRRDKFFRELIEEDNKFHNFLLDKIQREKKKKLENL